MRAERSFTTQWGANIDQDGTTRFRLWAPAQKSVRIRTEASFSELRPLGDGWHGIDIPGLTAESAYTFVLDDGLTVPDPAARAQVGDVHGPSRLIDPHHYHWENTRWYGRPWHEAVVYEIHVGTFTPEGTFRAAIDKLDHLANLGVTALELMPVAQFSGERGWGYDGVLLYAPHRVYGGPDALKEFVDAAHARGLMVLLDVVYNHFGPDGNYLQAYAPRFFSPERQTPWGAAIAYQTPAVRRFFIDNAIYWLEEYFLDGLRLDAIDRIVDPSTPHLLEDIARTVRSTITDREIHLTTEDNRNIVRLHTRGDENKVHLYTAEWNDDYHNIAHVIATGEHEGYYQDFSDHREARLARALTEGFVFQGEPSGYAGGGPRGEPSIALPPVAFIDFLQNHDQVGNRAFGERLSLLAPPDLLRIFSVMTVLSPSIPLLFMGEEWGETRPFRFFTDFHGDLAALVREGRRREFRAWSAFRDKQARARIPDPNDPDTFAVSRLDWTKCEGHDGWLQLNFIRTLLDIRRRIIVPRLLEMRGGTAWVRKAENGVVAVSWPLDDRTTLHLDANIADQARPLEKPPTGEILYSLPEACPTPTVELPGPGIVVHIEVETSPTHERHT